MSVISIKSAGPGVTLQDGGRRGYLRFGVTGAGPMDSLAFAAANLAVGNDRDATAIEVSSGGITLSCNKAAIDIAVAGGQFVIRRDGKVLPSASRLTLKPGELLEISSGESGNWCYVAIAGRVDLPTTLGSHATHTRTGFGGIDGRALKAGDEIPVADARSFGVSEGGLILPWPERPAGTIRVIAGPQRDYFADDQFSTFVTKPWTVSMRGDRMAAFLDGPQLTHVKGYNIVSDGIARGAIQVPGEGHPIVLMADRQPTGGYPKIANVISADIGALAQMQGGETFRFQEVSHDEAVEVLREHEAALSRIETQPFTRTSFEKGFFDTVSLTEAGTEGSSHSAGLTSKDRLALLFDPSSLNQRDAGGLVVAEGKVFGRSVFAYARNADVKTGVDVNDLAALYERASEVGAIVVSLHTPGDAASTQSADAAHLIAATAQRNVPEIALVSGKLLGADAFFASAADFVFTAGDAQLLPASAETVKRVVGFETSEANGFSTVHLPNEVAAMARIRVLIDLLKGEGEAVVPSSTSRSVTSFARKTIREKIHAVADHGDVFELHSTSAPAMLTYLARVGGVSCAIIANDPSVNDGVMDAEMLRKAERFVRLCTRFSIPLLRLWDTPGVLPTADGFAAGRDLLIALQDHKAGGITLDMSVASRLVPVLNAGPRLAVSETTDLREAALTALTGEML